MGCNCRSRVGYSNEQKTSGRPAAVLGISLSCRELLPPSCKLLMTKVRPGDTSASAPAASPAVHHDTSSQAAVNSGPGPLHGIVSDCQYS